MGDLGWALPDRGRCLSMGAGRRERRGDHSATPRAFAVGSFFAQGSPLSDTLNHAPFIKATAGIHEYIFNAGIPFKAVTNLLMMSPAALFAIPAALGNHNISWITTIKLPPGEAMKISQCERIADTRAFGAGFGLILILALSGCCGSEGCDNLWSPNWGNRHRAFVDDLHDAIGKSFPMYFCGAHYLIKGQGAGHAIVYSYTYRSGCTYACIVNQANIIESVSIHEAHKNACWTTLN